MPILRKGIHPMSGLIVPCADSNCLQCFDNIYNCELCNTQRGFLVKDFECFSSKSAQFQFGRNQQLSRWSPCAILGCLNCNSDYLLCEQCEESYGFNPMIDPLKCLHHMEFLAGYGLTINTILHRPRVSKLHKIGINVLFLQVSVLAALDIALSFSLVVCCSFGDPSRLGIQQSASDTSELCVSAVC